MAESLTGRRNFHALFLALFLGVWYLDLTNLDPKFLIIPGAHWSRLVWLTMLDLTFQTVYHAVALLVCITGVGAKNQSFHYMARSFFQPIAMCTFLLFWELWLFDPATLAKDENASKLIEFWPWNHGLHTLPLFSAVGDLIMWNRRTPATKSAMKAIVAFALFYTCNVTFFNWLSGGGWAYPILGELNTFTRGLFYAVSASHIALSFFVLRWVNKTILGRTEDRKRR